ncbi:hypothetical protein GH714_008739 [Hevea brasiliensis]|uniref:PI4-kinase N-terminal domain-containing protein n=1 Tax=Hevea brasiliensis TaxID=3981 RepID=A0A6A6LY18_HEVBR|nr:hypothetical protein GH714_008739 [Hevea brasiliensis]
MRLEKRRIKERRQNRTPCSPDRLEFHVRSSMPSAVALFLSKCTKRKRDWTEQGQGQLLKSRVNAKLSVYQAAGRMKLKCLASIDEDGNTTKRLVLETLAVMIDAAAAEACLLSLWRKLIGCAELFSSLLTGTEHIAVTKGGEIGTIPYSICLLCINMKLYLPLPEYYDRVDKEKQGVPAVHLNVIHLLANLTVAVNNSEVVDKILPLFIESREEGDASTPDLLRL